MIEDTTPEEWSRQMAVNVGGIFLCSKFFLPHLRKTRGSILNMASVNGFFVEPMCAGYCATKGAIIALTKAMAIDHGREGIRVNCICPATSTPGLPRAISKRRPTPPPPGPRPATCTRWDESAAPTRWRASPFSWPRAKLPS